MSRLRLKRPLVWLDLEATGLDPRRDRIVEISALKEWPDGRLEERTRRVNPGVPIPASATAVHGIRDEDVREEPRFEQLARSLAEFLEGADLGGFGIERYDAALLEAEFGRAGTPFSLEGRAVVDAQRVFHKQEPRDLAAACRFYLARELDRAHDARTDAEAAREVLLAQLERYPGVPEEPEAIAEWLRDPSRVDREGKLRWEGSEAVLNFGQHRGRSLRDLAARQPDYLRWMLGQGFSREVNARVEAALRGEFPGPAAPDRGSGSAQ